MIQNLRDFSLKDVKLFALRVLRFFSHSSLSRIFEEMIGGLIIKVRTFEGGVIERGLIREGGLFTKSSDKDLFGSFSVPYPIFSRINKQCYSSNT